MLAQAVRKAPESPQGSNFSLILIASGSELQVLSRALAVLAADELVLDPVTLVQTVESGPLDGRDVHESVGTTALRLDKPKSFGSIEPLHSSSIQELDLNFGDTPGDMPRREAALRIPGKQRATQCSEAASPPATRN